MPVLVLDQLLLDKECSAVEESVMEPLAADAASMAAASAEDCVAAVFLQSSLKLTTIPTAVLSRTRLRYQETEQERLQLTLTRTTRLAVHATS